MQKERHLPFGAHVRADFMTSKDIQQYLKHYDMVILPVGCFEMHGPQIPLSCDIYTEWAVDILLADLWQCLVFPPVAYSFAGATSTWPGTIDVAPDVTSSYLQAILKSLAASGFKRIVLSASHWPLHAVLSTLIQSFFQESGIVVLHLKPIPAVMPDDLMKETLGYRWGEDILMAAALKILGWHGIYNPAESVDKPTDFATEGLRSMADFGEAIAVPTVFSEDHRHAGIRSGITLEDADRAIEVIKRSIGQFAGLPAEFARYQSEMALLGQARPWQDPNIWSV